MAEEKAGRPRVLLRRHVLELKKDTRDWIEDTFVPQVNKGLLVSAVSKVDPIRIAAVVGLTVVLKPLIAGASDILGWYGKLFKGLGLAIEGQFTPETAGEILFTVPLVGGLYRSLFGAFLPAEVIEEMTEDKPPHNEVLEWMLALSAASLIVILGPGAIGLAKTF